MIAVAGILLAERNLPTGTIIVRLNPPVAGAELRIDGELAAGAAPWRLERPAGQHHLEISGGPTLAPFTQSVDLAAGATHEITAQLKALTGTLRIATEPAGLNLLINGKAIGASPQTLELPVGEVQVGHEPVPGRKTATMTVTVVAGRAADIVLKPKLIQPVSITNRPLAKLEAVAGPSWTSITIPARHGAAYAMLADKPVRVRVNGVVYLADGTAPVRLPAPSAGIIEIKAARLGKPVSVEILFEE